MSFYIVNISGDLWVYTDINKASEAARAAGVRFDTVRGLDGLCDYESTHAPAEGVSA